LNRYETFVFLHFVNTRSALSYLL